MRFRSRKNFLSPSLIRHPNSTFPSEDPSKSKVRGETEEEEKRRADEKDEEEVEDEDEEKDQHEDDSKDEDRRAQIGGRDWFRLRVRQFGGEFLN